MDFVGLRSQSTALPLFEKTRELIHWIAEARAGSEHPKLTHSPRPLPMPDGLAITRPTPERPQTTAVHGLIHFLIHTKSNHDNSMKFDRYFYSIASFVILLLTFLGFQHFYLEGKGSVGQPLTPPIAPVVIVHGLACTGWILLFFVQSLLIASRNRRLHMTLGLSAMGLAPIIAVTSLWVAIAGARLMPEFAIAGLPRPQFMLIMFTQIAAFVVFVFLGLRMRQQPRPHRAMMLLATMIFLPPAVTRTPFFNATFGEEGWWSFSSSMITFGALALVVRLILDRSIDRWFTAGFASLICAMSINWYLAQSETWGRVALWILH